MPKDTFFNLPAAKRQKLLDLAIEEFSENDYKNASVSKIVSRAGIAKGSFYQYFKNKEDLYLYLISLSVSEKTAFFQQFPPPQGVNIFEHFHWIIDVGFNFEFSNPRLARIGYRAIYDDAPLPEETRAAISEGALPYFRDLVTRGAQAGQINPQLDPEVAAFLLNTVFMNLGDFILERQNTQPDQLLNIGTQVLATPASKEILNQILLILERGLSAP